MKLNQDVISEVIAALRSDDAETRAFAEQYLDEVARTRSGHWHPEIIECSERCPIGDPRTRETFIKVLQEV